MSETGRVGNGSRSDQGVVIRLSADAQKILARRQGDDEDALLARRRDRDTDGDTAALSGAGVGIGLGVGPASKAPALVVMGTPVVGADGKPEPSGDGRGDDGQAKRVTHGGAAEPKQLTAEEKQVVSQLSARDTAVRAHEAAHQAAAQGLGGGASFSYETGPDGNRYAVGGEVPVALRPGRTPQETVSNAQVVRSAALAPADPSSQDLAVAAQASQMEAEAREEIVQDKRGASGVSGNDEAGSGSGAGRAAVNGQRDPVARAEGFGGGGRGEDQGAPAHPPRDAEQDQVMVFSTLKAERGTINGYLRSPSSRARAAARYTNTPS